MPQYVVELASADRAKSCLLAMLATQPSGGGPVSELLTVEEWDLIAKMAGQHRLYPLLHERLRARAPMPGEPASWRPMLADAYRQSALQALVARSVLSRIGDVLDAAGIVHVALKGADLAWHAYAHPALRPMRDLDVLAAPNQVLAAWEALLAAGFERDSSSTIPLDHAHADRKHLPPLVDPASGVVVELHTRLFELSSTGQPDCQMFDTARLLSRRIRRGGTACLPSAETLLHLIAHATREHHFDNGPQVIEDICVLLARGDIEWSRFWDMAAEGGWTRDCHLLFAITARFHGAQRVELVDRTEPLIPPGLIDDAARMMLQDFDERTDLTVQTQLASIDTAAGRLALVRRLFPRRHVLASYLGRADSPWVWLAYPAWLVSRLRRTWDGARSPAQRDQAARVVRIERWLAGD